MFSVVTLLTVTDPRGLVLIRQNIVAALSSQPSLLFPDENFKAWRTNLVTILAQLNHRRCIEH